MTTDTCVLLLRNILWLNSYCNTQILLFKLKRLGQWRDLCNFFLSSFQSCGSASYSMKSWEKFPYWLNGFNLLISVFDSWC
jgi:hypothetical protein